MERDLAEFEVEEKCGGMENLQTKGNNSGSMEKAYQQD